MGKVNNILQQAGSWQAPDIAGLVLADSDVHVYQVSISANLHLLQSFADTLTQAEKDRGNKYHQLKDRQRFVISRGAQRNILSRYVNLPPQALEFALGDNKKPFLAQAGAQINYNITHSGDLIVLAISRYAVGADAEFIDTDFAFNDILDEHFSPEEIAFIKSKNSTERFYQLWTRKEALLKATAQGLGEHLKITPSLDGEHNLPQSLAGADKNWQVRSFKQNDYFVSIATDIAAADLKFFDAS